MKPIQIGIVLVIVLIILYFCYQKRYEEHFRGSSLDVYYNNQTDDSSIMTMNKCGKLVLPGDLKHKPSNKVEVLSAVYYIDNNYSGTEYCDNTSAKYYNINTINDIEDRIDRTMQVSRAINYSLENGGTLENIQCSSYFSNKCFSYNALSDIRVSGSISPEGACYFWNNEAYGFGPQLSPSLGSKQTMEITYIMDGRLNKLKLRYGQPINLKSSEQSNLPVYITNSDDGKVNYTRMNITTPSSLEFDFNSEMNSFENTTTSLSGVPSLKFKTIGTGETLTADVYGDILEKNIIATSNENLFKNRIGIVIIPLTGSSLNNITLNPSDNTYLEKIALKSTFIPTFNSLNPSGPVELYPESKLNRYIESFPNLTYFFVFPVGLSWVSQQSSNLGNNSNENINVVRSLVPINTNNGNFIYVFQYNKSPSGSTNKYQPVFVKAQSTPNANGTYPTLVNSVYNTDSSTPTNTNVLKQNKFNASLESQCLPYYPDDNSLYWGSDYNKVGTATEHCIKPNGTQFNLDNTTTCNAVNDLATLVNRSGGSTGKATVDIVCKILDKILNFDRSAFNQSHLTLTSKLLYNKGKDDNGTVYTNSFKWVIEPIGNISNSSGTVVNTDNKGFCYIYSLRQDATGHVIRNYLTANNDDTVSIVIHAVNNTNNKSYALSSKQQWVLCEDPKNVGEYSIRSRATNKYLVYRPNGGYPSGPSVALGNVPNTAWKLSNGSGSIFYETFTGGSTSAVGIDCSSGINPFKTTAGSDTPATETKDRGGWNPCFASYWNGEYIYQETNPNASSPDFITLQLNQGTFNNEGTVIIPKLNDLTNITIPVIASSSIEVISKTMDYPRIFLRMLPFANVQLNGTTAPQNLIKLAGQLYLSPNNMINLPGGLNPNMFMIKKDLSPLLVNQSWLAAKGIQTGTYGDGVSVSQTNFVIVNNTDPKNCSCDKVCAFNIKNGVKNTDKGKNWTGAKAVGQAYRDSNSVLHVQDVGKSFPNDVQELDCYCEEDNLMPYLNDCKDCKDLVLPSSKTSNAIEIANLRNCDIKISAVVNLVKYSKGLGNISSFFRTNPKLVGNKYVDYDGGINDGNITLFSFSGYSQNISGDKNIMTAVNTYSMLNNASRTTSNVFANGISVPDVSFNANGSYTNFPYYIKNTAHINPQKFTVYMEFDMSKNMGQYGLFGKEGYHFGIQIYDSVIFPYASSGPNQYPKLNGNPATFWQFKNVLGSQLPTVESNGRYKMVVSWDFTSNNMCQMRITLVSNTGVVKCYTYTTGNVSYYSGDTKYDYNIGVQAAGSACNCNEFNGTIRNVMFFADKFMSCSEAESMVKNSQNAGMSLQNTVYLFNKPVDGMNLRPITIVNSKNINGNSYIYPGTSQDFKLQFSCNPGLYPQISGSDDNIEQCCRGPYPTYTKQNGDVVNVSNSKFTNSEVVNNCLSGLTSSLSSQSAGIGDLNNYTYETYYVEGLPNSFPKSDNMMYMFSGASNNQVGLPYSITPKMSSKVAIALMGNMGTKNDLEAINYNTDMNTCEVGWVLSGDKVQYGYIRKSGDDKTLSFGNCPNEWRYEQSNSGCYAPSNGENRGTCSNPSYFGGYSDNDKRNWAHSCGTVWTAHIPSVTMTCSENKYKGVNLNNKLFSPDDTVVKANVWIKGIMPIYFPMFSTQNVSAQVLFKPLGINDGGKYQWKDVANNCLYSQYAIQKYDDVSQPSKILNNRSMYLRMCS